MKQFFQTFFACLLAVVASGILMSLLLVMVLSGMFVMVSGGGAMSAKPNSVLRIEFEEPVVDNPERNLWEELNPYTFSITYKTPLIDVISTLERAADDKNISGIYLAPSPYMSIGLARLEEVRAELARFKESGKFIVSYSDYYTSQAYYLASVADKVFINPEGSLDWRGMSSQTAFFKGSLEKLGVSVEAIRAGDYKSAVEPFTMDRMSDENRAQTGLLVNGVWGNIVSDVALSRSLDVRDMQDYATRLSATEPGPAKKLGLVDSVMYYDQVADYMAGLAGVSSEKLEFVPFTSYMVSPTMDVSLKHRNKIAVIYAEGEIIDGKGRPGYIGGVSLSGRLRAAGKDKSVKAVVLRVSSPGGSALASDVIWREMDLLRKEKPLVVSMGNYAASGGYYISAPADLIVANRNTITGSIGVFGLLMDAGGALKDKLGITFDGVRTNPSADIGSVLRKPSEAERDYLQGRVNRVYDTFVSRVAAGRNLSEDSVREIGGGRVWSGVSALDRGLVDYNGGLKDAILFAADRAGVSENYKIVSPLGAEDGLASLFMRISLKIFGTDRQNSALGAMRAEFDKIARVLERDEVQALMPYSIELE